MHNRDSRNVSGILIVRLDSAAITKEYKLI